MIGGQGNPDVLATDPPSDARGLVVRVVDGATTTAGAIVQTSVAASTQDVVLLAENAARLGFSIFNDSTDAKLYVHLGPEPATTTNFVARVAPGGSFEPPINYTGEVHGIWDLSSGAARVSEYLATDVEPAGSNEALYRYQIRNHLFGSQVLPTATPDAFEPGYTPAWPYNIYNVKSPNLLRIDRITHHVDDDVVVYAYHYVNTSGSKKLFISHEGHSYFNLTGHEVHIEQMLHLGWNVVLVQMPQQFSPDSPPAEPDPSMVLGHDDWALPRETDDPTYLRTFFLPTLYAKSHLQQTYGYDTFAMVGLSGGGWTTTFMAALDTDIRAAWCVSGTMPQGVYPPTDAVRDYEQRSEANVHGSARPVFAFLPENYLDLYAMSATDERFFRLVYVENEAPPYWPSAGLHAEIDAYVAEADARVTGTVAVSYDTTQNDHIISPFTRDVIVADLLAEGISAVGPTGATIIEPTFTNLIARYHGDQMSAAQLTDLSGNGNHAVQAVAANQGQIITDPYLGLPVLQLTPGGAGDDFYRCNSVLVGGGAAPAYTEYSVLAIFRPRVREQFGVIFEATAAGGVVFTGPILYQTEAANGTLFFACAAGANLASKTNWNTNGWCWVLATHDGATRKIYANGVLVAQNNVADTSPAISVIGVGKSLDPAPFYPFDGYIRELVFCGSVPSLFECARYARAAAGL